MAAVLPRRSGRLRALGLGPLPVQAGPGRGRVPAGARWEGLVDGWVASDGAVGAAATWAWRLDAACRQADTGIFFGRDGERPPERSRREARAKAICAICPVITACGSHALEHDERFGVWGGMSERERAWLRESSQATG